MPITREFLFEARTFILQLSSLYGLYAANLRENVWLSSNSQTPIAEMSCNTTATALFPSLH